MAGSITDVLNQIILLSNACRKRRGAIQIADLEVIEATIV
jgi:hypothetical protein